MMRLFKRTEEAIQYGLSLRGNYRGIDRLKKMLTIKKQQVTKQMNIAQKTKKDQDGQRAINLSFEAQLIREALETALGSEVGLEIMKGNYYGK